MKNEWVRDFLLPVRAEWENFFQYFDIVYWTSIHHWSVIFIICCVAQFLLIIITIVHLYASQKEQLISKYYSDEYFAIFISPTQLSWRGVYWFHLVHLPVFPYFRLWTEECLLCIFHNTSQILIIFTHVINQLQKVCAMLSCETN